MCGHTYIGDFLRFKSSVCDRAVALKCVSIQYCTLTQPIGVVSFSPGGGGGGGGGGGEECCSPMKYKNGGPPCVRSHMSMAFGQSIIHGGSPSRLTKYTNSIIAMYEHK